MSDARSIIARIAAGADDAPAIAAPERRSLTHGGLRRLIAEAAGQLNALGIGRGDRVAIVLPNGPEMATAFLAVAATATTAPLNPAYRAEEFDFYLTDIGAKAILVAEDESRPGGRGRRAARHRRCSGWSRSTRRAGRHVPASRARRSAPAAAAGLREADDIALLLHTSGTTSRPKMVPLSHANLAASAGHIGATLGLTADDRCLNIMPLFHIHGLIAAVLSSLSAGGSVFCTPGFNALRFFQWLGEAKPTWYTAVPTMHQAILARARAQPGSAGRAQAALHPLVLGLAAAAGDGRARGDLRLPGDRVLRHDRGGAPDGVEPAAARPAQGRQRRHRRRAGGRDHGAGRAHCSPPGETGEIVIRGPNVTAGYENNPEANAAAFAHGWFHTGDQGTLDADGYLRITGRLKEIINRGGEKISPLEVDEVLMDHPAVAQVVTFAMPHDKLGEEVAAAIVLREGSRGERARDPRFRRDAARRLQGAAQDRDPRGDPEGRDRQAAAHRPGGKTRPRMMRIAVFGAGAIGGYRRGQARRGRPGRPVDRRARRASRRDARRTA